MDSGLGVQWPLSPFATAVATGAFFAFCVAFFKKRYRRQPAPESDSSGTSTDDGSTVQYNSGPQLDGYSGAIRRHVLKLEIPTDIIDTSAFGFSSVSYSRNNCHDGQSEVVTFALPRISDQRICPLTISLLNNSDKFFKFSFGLRPYIKERFERSIVGHPIIPFPKLDPREGLRFGLNNFSGWPLEFTRHRNTFRKSCVPSNIIQENYPHLFRNFNFIENKLLISKSVHSINRPITYAAKNILLRSELRTLSSEISVLSDREFQLKFLENTSQEVSCESKTIVFSNISENDNSVRRTDANVCFEQQIEMKCDNLNENANEMTDSSNKTIFKEENDKLISQPMNNLTLENLLSSESDCFNEGNIMNLETGLKFNSYALKSNGNSNQKILGNEADNLNRNVVRSIEFVDLTENNHLDNSGNMIDLDIHVDVMDGRYVELEDKIASERSVDPPILQRSKNINSVSGVRNEAHRFFETSVPYGSSNCQDVMCEKPEPATRVLGGVGTIEVKKSINDGKVSFQQSKSMMERLERVQERSDKREGAMREAPRKYSKLSLALETKQTIGEEANLSEYSIGEGKAGWGGGGITTNGRDVKTEGERGGATSRTRTADEREAFAAQRQMDRLTGERSDAADDSSACVFETSVTSETRIRENGGTRVSTAITSSLTLDTADAWSSGAGYHNGTVKTVVRSHEEIFRPTYEEYMPDESKSLDATINELKEIADRPLISSEPSSPRVSRLKALLSRDEERRARMKFFQEKSSSVNGSGGKAGASIDGEWDRILRDVLASVSELEHWEKDEEQRRRCDVTDPKPEDAEKLSQHHHSHSSPSMEGEDAVISPTKGETPTKVKNLRFKLDPDVFDVPSDDSFYDDDDDDVRRSGIWRRQPKYRTFSTLELKDEPVKLVSVHASVVPAGQKMVARPVGIDLRVRLTEERQSKRAHVGTSPSQVKRRSPVSDTRVGWCQELSPVTENVDWRETFTNVPREPSEAKPIPNGILKTPSPKAEPVVKDSANPFKVENELTNGTPVVIPKKIEKPISNGVPWKPPERKVVPLPRRKFQPDPEAVDRITGYKLALSKPPLPPPVFHRGTSPTSKINRAELARKQYLDSKAALSAPKVDSNKKFQQFLTQAQNDRAKIVTSVPDLGAIEKAVSEQWARERTPVSQRTSPMRDDISKPGETPSSRCSTPDDAWTSYVQSCRKHLGRRSQSMTYLETDVDILVVEDDDKWRSTSALVEPDNSESSLPLEDSDLDRSHEDLDDSGRAKSEHELRIQKSLQSLPLPAWYKQSDKPKSGFLLGSAAKEKRGWAAAKSLASSTSSLASCGLKRPIRSLRSSRENIPWSSRGSPSPDGPALSLALAKAFREPYLGWRARTSTTSSGVSSSPRTSPPSWSVVTTDEEVNGVSFDGEDAFGHTSSQDDHRDDPPSVDDTGADAVTVSMDTGDLIKLPGGEDTCDDINNMSMDTCELFDVSVVPDPQEEQPSPQADTGDDIDNLSTDTTEDKRKDPKFKRFSYSQSIYHSEWEEGEESRGDRKSLPRDGSPSSDNKVIWIESSFVGSRTTTSIVVLPDEKRKREGSMERPASR